MKRGLSLIAGAVCLTAAAGAGHARTGIAAGCSDQPCFALESTIAFTSTREAPTGEIYLVRPDGSNIRRLTDNSAGDGFAAFAPDGKKLVFDSDRLTGAVNSSDLFVMDADGGAQTFLTRGSSASWSPSGKEIAFHASASYYASGGLVSGTPIRMDPGSATTDSDLFVANVDDLSDGTPPPVNVTNTPAEIEDDADWSPAGDKLVFTKHDAADNHSNPLSAEIYVANTDGSGTPTQLTDNAEEERGPAWSPDGERIVFSCRRGDPPATPPGAPPTFEICVMNADGSGVERLTTNAVPDLTATWAPDGEAIVFHRRVGGQLQLFTMKPSLDANGSQPTATQITTGPGQSLLANWGVVRVRTAGAAADEAAPTATREAAAPAVEAVMSGLDNPRGLAFGPQGALYVAEAGRGDLDEHDGPCVRPGAIEVCYGATGAVSRLWRGEQERVAVGLPSYATATGRATGPQDIAMLGVGAAHLTIGLEASPLLRDELASARPEWAGFGRLVQMTASGDWRITADVAGFEAQWNPDPRVVDSNPFGILTAPGGDVVADAGGNSLLHVGANGDISLLAVLPPVPQANSRDAVPTSVVSGPDGAYYVGQLTGVPFVEAAAAVYRIVPGESPQVFRSGFKAIIDVAFDADGNLYVLQHATGATGLAGPGMLIRVAPDGTRTRILDGLDRPTAVAVGPDGSLYVSNHGLSVGGGEVLRIDAGVVGR